MASGNPLPRVGLEDDKRLWLKEPASSLWLSTPLMLRSKYYFCSFLSSESLPTSLPFLAFLSMCLSLSPPDSLSFVSVFDSSLSLLPFWILLQLSYSPHPTVRLNSSLERSHFPAPTPAFPCVRLRECVSRLLLPFPPPPPISAVSPKPVLSIADPPVPAALRVVLTPLPARLPGQDPILLRLQSRSSDPLCHPLPEPPKPRNDL